MTTTPKSQGAAIDQAGAPAGYVERLQLEWLIRRTGDTASIQLWRGHAPVDAVPVYLAAPAGDTQQAEDAALWRELVADIEAFPCDYPCLRDDLADWLSKRG